MATDYLNNPTTVDPATTDINAMNFGSAFSSPGSLSSTNLATPSSSSDLSALNDPNYFTSGGASPTGSGSPMAPAAPGYTMTPSGPVPTSTTGSPAAGAPAAPSSGFNWGNLLSGIGNTALNLAPSLLTAGVGLSQAKDAQKQNDAFAKQLTDLGGPYTAAGQQLLKQFQSGQIRPDQANVANLATSQGQSLIDSGSGLSSIAQSAYKDYQAGKLPPADEQRLADQSAAQKQEMRQRLSQQGITDSSILAGYDQQIENQANINRQDLLDKRFATGNTAYDQWLKSTSEGQALKLEGAKFASQSLDNMLTQSLNLGAEGMRPITQAIELKMQSDSALAAQVQQLMGNLAGAYAYGKTGGQVPGGGGGGTTGAALGTASSALNLAGKAVGGGGAPSGGYTSGLGTGAAAPSNAFDPNYFNASQQQPIYDASGMNPVTSSPGATDPLAALNNPNYFTDTSTIQPIDTSGGVPPPSAAGGEAAAGGGMGTGAELGLAGGALGVASGLSQGSPTGYAKAGLGATQLAAKTGFASPNAGTAASGLMGALGIYTGLQKGGVAGYAGAAVGAGQIAGAANALEVSSATAAATAGGASASEAAAAGAAASSPGLALAGKAAGAAAIPLSLYGEIKTWQSGATGADALSGAETGAAIGTYIMPGVGTLIGAVLGGVGGAISSIFGSGKKGAAAGNWDQLTKSNALKSTPGRNFSEKSWGEAFKGMLDEGNNIFAGGGKDRHKDPDALAKPLEAQVKGAMTKLGPNATTDQVYNQVIVPWMQTSGSGINWGALQNEPQQQLMIKSAVDRVLAGEPIVRSEMQSYSAAPANPGQSLSRALGMGGRR